MPSGSKKRKSKRPSPNVVSPSPRASSASPVPGDSVSHVQAVNVLRDEDPEEVDSPSPSITVRIMEASGDGTGELASLVEESVTQEGDFGSPVSSLPHRNSEQLAKGKQEAVEGTDVSTNGQFATPGHQMEVENEAEEHGSQLVLCESLKATNVASNVEARALQLLEPASNLDIVGGPLEDKARPAQELQNEAGEVVSPEFPGLEEQATVTDDFSVTKVLPDEPLIAAEDCEENISASSEADADATEMKCAKDATQEPADAEAMEQQDTFDELNAKENAKVELIIDTKEEDAAVLAIEQWISPSVIVVGVQPTLKGLQTPELTGEGGVPLACDGVEAEVPSEEVAYVEHTMPLISVEPIEGEFELEDTITGPVLEACTAEAETSGEPGQSEVEVNATLEGDGTYEKSLQQFVTEDKSEITIGEGFTQKALPAAGDEAIEESDQDEVKIERALETGETSEEPIVNDVKVEPTLEAGEVESEVTNRKHVFPDCTPLAEAIEESSQADIELEATLESGGTNEEYLGSSVVEDESEIAPGEDLTKKAVSAAKDEITKQSCQDEVKIEPTLETGEKSEGSIQDIVRVEHTLEAGETNGGSRRVEVKEEPALEMKEVYLEDTMGGVVSHACTADAEAIEEFGLAEVELEDTLGGDGINDKSFQLFIAEDKSEIATGGSLSKISVAAVKGETVEECSRDAVKAEFTLEAGETNEESKQDEVVIEPAFEAEDEPKVEFNMERGASNQEHEQNEVRVNLIMEKVGANEHFGQGKAGIASNMEGGGINGHSDPPPLVEGEAEINTGGDSAEAPMPPICSTGDEIIKEYGRDGVDAETSLEQGRSYELTDENQQDEAKIEMFLQDNTKVSLQPSLAEKAKFISGESEESLQMDLATYKAGVITEENECTEECIEERVEPVGLSIDECMQPSHTKEFRASETSETGEVLDADSGEAAKGQYVSSTVFEDNELPAAVDQSLKEEEPERLRGDSHLDDPLPSGKNDEVPSFKEDKMTSISSNALGDKEELSEEFSGGLTEAGVETFDNGGHGLVKSLPVESSNTMISREVSLNLVSGVVEKDVHVDQRSLQQKDTTVMQAPTIVVLKSNWWGCCGMFDALFQKE